MELVNDRWTKGQTMKRGLLCALLWASLISTQGQGTILWDEAVNGPLSNDYMRPADFGTLSVGSNSLMGTTEYIHFGGNGALYGDYWQLKVADSSQLSAIVLRTDKQVLLWLGDGGFSETLAYVYNPANGDLLPQLGLLSINSGTYGMYIKMNQFSETASASYRLDFIVEAVPEPASLWLLLVGLSGLGFRNWRKS